MRQIVIQEALRAMAITWFSMMGWAYLCRYHLLPASGWTLVAVVLGIPLACFLVMVWIRRRTGWELRLRGWALVAFLAGSWILFMLVRAIFAR